MPLPLKKRIIEKYLMKKSLNYDIVSLINLIKSCDNEYIAINNESLKK